MLKNQKFTRYFTDTLFWPPCDFQKSIFFENWIYHYLFFFKSYNFYLKYFSMKAFVFEKSQSLFIIGHTHTHTHAHAHAHEI